MRDVVREGVFFLKGKDFDNAGAASSEIKAVLEGVGVDRSIIRRAAIASFEAEMNVIIYTPAGILRYKITSDYISVVFDDVGPGIEDVNLAMKEGYSTAPDHIRDMGFGSGMGLPNIKKNTDELKISSQSGVGTILEFIINLGKKDEVAGNN
jgi:serine/threonine-protein kinase RsbT